MSALFIILVSLKMTLFSEKVLISNRCVSGLMSNLIKKSLIYICNNLQLILLLSLLTCKVSGDLSILLKIIWLRNTWRRKASSAPYNKRRKVELRSWYYLIVLHTTGPSECTKNRWAFDNVLLFRTNQARNSMT